MTAISPIAWMPEGALATTAIDEPATADFGALLKTGANRLIDQTDQATELLSAYAVGENVAAHELVMAMEQAKLSLQLAVEVRNRLVDAYQELTRLQI
jgi:flagellar hook-basal body complex protein FliE